MLCVTWATVLCSGEICCVLRLEKLWVTGINLFYVKVVNFVCSGEIGLCVTFVTVVYIDENFILCYGGKWSVKR